MRNARRYYEALLGALYLMVVVAAVAAAHDCSGPDDCGVIPPNVDIATGIGAVGAGSAIGWALLHNRNKKPDTDCQDLRKEVEAGESRIKDLEAKVAAAQADWERAVKAAEQNPEFDKELPANRPKWIT